MLTEEFVIDDDTMEALRERANNEGVELEDLKDRFVRFITDSCKNIPPELIEIQRRNRQVFSLDSDFNCKEEVSNELYNKYVSARNFH